MQQQRSPSGPVDGDWSRILGGETITNHTLQEETDTETGSIRTQKNSEYGHPLSAYVVELLKAEPDRTFHVREVAGKTREKSDTVNRTLSRLSKTGKGGGPVQKVSHGYYKYDPTKEKGNLLDFAWSGVFRIENMTIVRKGARGISGQSPKIATVDLIRTPELAWSGQETGINRTLSDTSIPIPKMGYPCLLATGQEIFWGTYLNGTEIIRISANGKPPISIDLMLQLLEWFKTDAFNVDEWQCTCFEVNKDDSSRWLEGAYTMRVLEGLLFKAYNHGNAARLEIANRQPIPLREVTDLFNYLQGGIEGKESLRKADALEARVTRNEKATKLALNIARTVRDNKQQTSPNGGIKKTKSKRSPFMTGAEIKKERADNPSPKQHAPLNIDSEGFYY